MRRKATPLAASWALVLSAVFVADEGRVQAQCSPTVTEYVISEEGTWTYSAVDQVSMVQNGTTLNAALRYQIYNVQNPGGEIDQLFLAADWTVLATIYDGHPGACPGVVANWSDPAVNLSGLAPGTYTLYAVRTAATSEAAGRYHYEVEHGGWRVAMGSVTVGEAPTRWFHYEVDSHVGDATGLAIDQTQRPVVMWGYPSSGTELRYRRWSGTSWTPIRQILVDGPVVFGDIAVASDNTPRVVWSDIGITSVRFAVGNWDGTSWGPEPETVETFGDWWKGGVVSSIALGADDTPQLAYFLAPPEDARHAIRSGGGAWTLTTVDSSGSVGKGADLAVDAANHAHIVCYHQDANSIRYITNSSGSWVASTILTPGTHARIIVDATGTPHVMIYDEGNRLRKYAKLTGSTWTITLAPHAGPSPSGPDLVLDASGRVHTLVLEDWGATLWDDVYDGANWTSEALPADFNGMNPLRLAIDSADNVYALARALDGSLQLITTAALIDCNSNGIGDDQDIANGTSEDCNGNAIPDECDIAEGTSADCDGNGVPDECEADFDGDGLIDACDPDIDNDGVLNDADVCDYTPTSLPVQYVEPDGSVKGDLDGDCDVDLADYALMQQRFTGPNP
ncbi:MAG: thrombospondin type 3 repeat-containing protein [Planctomycetota bacterium]